MTAFAGEQKSACRCLEENVVVESLVIAFTLVAGIAITCRSLLEFEIIIVPRTVYVSDENSSQNVSHWDNKDGIEAYTEIDKDMQDLLELAFLYVNTGITALFLIEILLKATTLRKTFLTRPSQLLDGFIVILCAAFQAVFIFMSIPKIFYYSSYLILARLWRVCTVCNLNANRVKERMEKDIEHRITDHLKTRQKCIILENISMQQENQIKDLRAQRMKLSEIHDKRELSRTSQQISEKRLSSEDIKNSNMDSSDGYNEGRRKSRSSSRKSSKGMNESFKANHLANLNVNLKPRWRRSSTTEYLERRMTLHSDHDDFSQTSIAKPASMSNLLTLKNKNDVDSLGSTVDCTSDYFDDIDGKQENVSLKTLSGSDTSLSTDVTRRKCQFKRQNSCPECMFTQRMKITKYESMLIEDHRLRDSFAYNNDGYFPEEDGIPLSVLASVHNESGTYRSQDGIPTTDL